MSISSDCRTESEKTVDKALRYRQILSILSDKEMTAKEIAVEMFMRNYTATAERNNSAPRLTELCKDGRVDVVGKRVCKYTGKKVSVYQRKEATA